MSSFKSVKNQSRVSGVRGRRRLASDGSEIRSIQEAGQSATTHASYVGRVGALAVALGVGLNTDGTRLYVSNLSLANNSTSISTVDTALNIVVGNFESGVRSYGMAIEGGLLYVAATEEALNLGNKVYRYSL